MNKYLAFAAFATLMLASCSNDSDLLLQNNLKDTPITVSAAVEGMLTRAGYDTENLPETFYLSIDQEGTDYDYTNVLMTKDADANTYSAPEGTTLLWKDGNHESATVNAYTTDTEEFSVQTDQSTAVNVLGSDLLGAVKATENTDIAISGNNIAVNFRHLLCKLDVTYTWGTELAAVTSKSIKGVQYVGFGSEVTLDRAAAAVTNGTATADITALVTDLTSEAIFAPYVGETAKIVITTMIDDTERIFSINVAAPADGFVSGNRYTMNVTIGGTTVETGKISIANGWGDSITGDDMQTN